MEARKETSEKETSKETTIGRAFRTRISAFASCW
jgi:hypothetical protein